MVTVSILSDQDHKYGIECAEMVRVSAALQPLHQNMSRPPPLKLKPAWRAPEKPGLSRCQQAGIVL